MYAIAGPSVLPSVTRVDQSKMIAVRIIQYFYHAVATSV